MTGAKLPGRLADLLARRREPHAVRRYAATRAPEVQAALDAAPAGFLLLAGNSHAEGVGYAMPPGLPVVNAGVCGVCAPRYAALLTGLTFPRPPGTAVVFLGSNDIRRDWRPRSAGALRRFDAAVSLIVSRLQAAGTGRVLLAAVPPIGAAAVARRDPAAVAVYTARLHALAGRLGAVFCDPFAGICDGVDGVAATGLRADGLHLAEFGGLAAALQPETRTGHQCNLRLLNAIS